MSPKESFDLVVLFKQIDSICLPRVFQTNVNLDGSPCQHRSFTSYLFLVAIWIETLYTLYCYSQPYRTPEEQAYLLEIFDESFFLMSTRPGILRFALGAYRVFSVGIYSTNFLMSHDSVAIANKHFKLAVNFRPVFKADRLVFYSKLIIINNKTKSRTTSYNRMAHFVILGFVMVVSVNSIWAFYNFAHPQLLPVLIKFVFFAVVHNLIVANFCLKFILTCKLFYDYVELVNSILIRNVARLVDVFQKSDANNGRDSADFREKLKNSYRSFDLTFNTFHLLLMAKKTIDPFLRNILVAEIFTTLPCCAFALTVSLNKSFVLIFRLATSNVLIFIISGLLQLSHQAGYADFMLKMALHKLYGNIRQLPLGRLKPKFSTQILEYFSLVYNDSIAIVIFGIAVNATTSIKLLSFCFTIMTFMVFKL